MTKDQRPSCLVKAEDNMSVGLTCRDRTLPHVLEFLDTFLSQQALKFTCE